MDQHQFLRVHAEAAALVESAKLNDWSRFATIVTDKEGQLMQIEMRVTKHPSQRCD